MPTTAVHPVQTLREHATAFEAAISVCLAGADHKAVHKLRTQSRRLEAQIALLAFVKGLPTHRAETAKALQHLKKLRQAAGRVRDLDVQVGHLGERAEAGEDDDRDNAKQRADDLQEMIAKRKHRRDKSAAKLLKLLEGKQAKVSAALEDLLKALKPAATIRISPGALLESVEGKFRRNEGLKRRRPSGDALHEVRKAAKQARYLAETAASPAGKAAARRYEDLQEAGGQWHDWLELAAAAKDELGRKHGVTAEFAALRDRHLASYMARLEQFRP